MFILVHSWLLSVRFDLHQTRHETFSKIIGFNWKCLFSKNSQNWDCKKKCLAWMFRWGIYRFICISNSSKFNRKQIYALKFPLFVQLSWFLMLLYMEWKLMIFIIHFCLFLFIIVHFHSFFIFILFIIVHSWLLSVRFDLHQISLETFSKIIVFNWKCLFSKNSQNWDFKKQIVQF